MENSLIEQLYEAYLAHPSITTDSRKVEPGQIFFALKGERFDGNAYVDEVLAKGASLAVIDDASRSKEGTFLVPDVLTALQQLAAHHRQQFRNWQRPVKVIGITGTNGKTTTKELIRTVLGRKFNVLATEGNLNNQIGVPLTLLRVKPEHELAIVEMGANHPMDIAELCAIVHPDFGLITNVGKAIESYEPQNMRSQLVDLGYGNQLIMDAYNANATSMHAALSSFKMNNAPHKSVILGDMRELGDESQKEHGNVLNYLFTSGIELDMIVLVGEEFCKAFKTWGMTYAKQHPMNVRCFDNVQDLIDDGTTLGNMGGTILVKGSRSMQLEKAAEAIKNIFINK